MFLYANPSFSRANTDPKPTTRFTTRSEAYMANFVLTVSGEFGTQLPTRFGSHPSQNDRPAQNHNWLYLDK
jgi:hypothetical protein